MSEENTKLLESLSLSGQALTDTLSNESLTETIVTVTNEIGDVENLDIVQKKLILDVCKIKSAVENLIILAKYVVDGSASKPQVSAAQGFLKKLKNKPLDVETFNSACGIGIFFTEEQVEAEVAAIIEENMEQLMEKRYNFVSQLFGKVRGTNLKFADGKTLNETLNKQVTALLGPKKGKVKKEKPREKRGKVGERETAIQESITFPDPSENEQVTPELLEKHLKETGGKVVTRFPPEPNGYLHIGHSKAMSLSYGYAKKLGGICYMRFDDTNPETEKQEYIDQILENVKWLGHEWVEVTYSSDYFDQLYECAVELINRGYAYICHQTSEQIMIERENKQPSPWRDRPIEESLREFQRMKDGLYKEGEATLRMKMDYLSPNPNMWDQVAYRIKFMAHPRSGDKWCIYPSYDFTHCIVDSIENITHSLCTLEFESRHESYNWLLDVLGLYKPLVWEYGRLSITHVVLSKRKLIELVEGDFGLDGWDDPRLPTINGYRRRGYTPESIHSFCEDIGVTRKPDVVIPIEKFEYFIREHLNVTAPRAFVVVDPVKLVITDWTDGVVQVECPNMPGNEELGTHSSPFSANVYIEREDFKETDVKGYFGLALNTANGEPKWVRLKYAGVIVKLVEIVKDEAGNVTELRCEHAKEHEIEKPSGTIHWVAEPEEGVEPLKIEIRDYETLFLSDNPIGKFGKEYLKDLNPNSLTVRTGYADPSILAFEEFDKAQFERVGFYCKDKDSTPELPVFNRTVSLKESSWKKQRK